MANLEVLFHVPQHIEAGLASGLFERVGGVIRESGSKQVIAWLRDGTTLSESSRELVSASGQLMQTLGLASPIAQVLNLTLTGVTFRLMMQRVDQLSEQVQSLGSLVKKEFKQDRDIRFKSALQSARDAFETNNASNRVSAAHSATLELFQAREQLLSDFREEIGAKSNTGRLQIAQHYLIRALYAETSRIRCYLIAQDIDMAKSRLSEDLKVFHEATKQLVTAWMGRHPAIYLHKSVSDDIAHRFLNIQRWLLNDQSPPSLGEQIALFDQIINQLRKDFWNEAVMKTPEFVRLTQEPNLLKRVSQPTISAIDHNMLANRLSQAEIIVENYRRLQGFELELRSMRLSMQDWEGLVSDDDLKENLLAIIIDRDMDSRLAS